MAIFNEFPQTNFHELNLDWIVGLVKHLEKSWSDFIINWDDDLYLQVSKWLTEHPEATTTVLDHSLTSIKLNGKIPFYNVTDYGIEPNSGDVYDELHDLIANYVYYTGGVLFFPKGKYTLSDCIFIPENTIMIGEGSDTEIYFDETHTYYGTAISNAGSNVSIKNIRFSQASTGIFHAGSQPGSIGFSDNHKDMAKVAKHSTTLLRDDVHDLSAENLFFDGIYALQSENDDNYSMTNIIYRNIYAPNCCVSLEASTKGIKNVIMDNITCDLFRIHINITNGSLQNIAARNINCNTVYINNHDLDQMIMIENLVQSDSLRHNDVLIGQDASALLNGNITMQNCVLTSITGEEDGILVYNGIRKFCNCIFNCSGKVVTRNAALADTTNYEIMNDCVINNDAAADTSFLLGYGSNNRITHPDRVYKWLWGDLQTRQTSGIVLASTEVSNTHPTVLSASGDSIRLSGYYTFTQNDKILPISPKLTNMPLDMTNIPVLIWNSSNREGTQIATYAIIDNDGYLKIAEYNLETSTAYDRILFDFTLPALDVPTPSQIFNLLSV